MSRLKQGGALVAMIGGVAAVAVPFITGEEGLRTKAYRDVIGVPTVCVGETKGVRMGMTFTKAQCEAMLLNRLDEFGDGIEKCVPSLKQVSPKRYAAHLSLAYNIGTGGYCRSSIARLQNGGKPVEACDAFLKFNRAGGRVVAGLTRRRKAERELCRNG